MVTPKNVVILILATIVLGIVPVSANPWTNFQKIESFNDIPTVSEMSWNSFPDTSNNLKDPFQNTYIQYSQPDIPKINPFDNYAMNTLSDIPSTSSYQYSLDDPARQMRYSTDLATQSRIMDTMSIDAQKTIALKPMEQVFKTSSPLNLFAIDGVPKSVSSNFKTPPTSVDSLTLTSVDSLFPAGTGSFSKMYGLGKQEFQYLGYSTQIMSPPPIDASKYTSTQFGPYGTLGGQAIATSDLTMDTMRIRQSDQIYTTGIYEKGPQMDHFYTEKIDYMNTPITTSPGVTATGYSYKDSYFYTPLGSGPGAWVGSRFETTFPNGGYDPSTDIGRINYDQRITYTQNINPSGLYGYNTIPTVNYNIPDYNYNIPDYNYNYNIPSYTGY